MSKQTNRNVFTIQHIVYSVLYYILSTVINNIPTSHRMNIYPGNTKMAKYRARQRTSSTSSNLAELME